MTDKSHFPDGAPPGQAGDASSVVSPAAVHCKPGFALAVMVVVLAFIVPICQLIHFSISYEFSSYILLVPFISAYLIWIRWPHVPVNARPARRLGIVFLIFGLATVLAYWIPVRAWWQLSEKDYLALMMVSFLLCFLGVCCLFCDRTALRAVRFPLGLLIFMVPIPMFAMAYIDLFLQNGSAVFAQVFFSLSGTPFLRDGLAFQLPDITLQIAPECSGIQSSLVLLITSLLAAYLFLRTPWKRALLILFMVPLGLIRNGFRVFVIGELCVHFGPHMINSYIHHRGGPIFFVLFLVPLFLLLFILRRSEMDRRKSGSNTPETKHA